MTALPIPLWTAIVDSPVGQLAVIGTADAVTAITWRDATTDPSVFSAPSNAAPAVAACQLAEYFAGRRTTFDIALALEGSDFQRRVWRALDNIPFGTVVSYGELARRVASAPRPVGMACGRNPVPIIVPCHRVVASTGKLTGYSAGAGIETKRRLLALEGQHDLFARPLP